MSITAEDTDSEPLIRAVSERLPVILREVENLLRAEHPEYATFLAEEFEDLVAAARGFVTTLLRGARLEVSDRRGAPRELGAAHQRLFEEIGRAHCQDRRDVMGLLAAYRLGATVAWRHIVDQGSSVVSGESLAAAATVLFAVIDELSAASLRGYLRQEAEEAGHRDRTRERLVELLLSDRAGDASIASAAQAAGWPLPARAALVLLSDRHRQSSDCPPRLVQGWLWSQRPDMTVGIVPDPDGPGRRARLATALRGSHAVIGESVELRGLAASFRPAQLALNLHEAGVLDADPMWVDRHLDTLIVHQAPNLLTSLRRRLLAPLDGLAASSRARLEQTLCSWLTQLGNRRAMSHQLHLHPQTVRYRLAQLRELFGPNLDDPAIRAGLTLALVWGEPAQRNLQEFGAERPPVTPAA